MKRKRALQIFGDFHSRQGAILAVSGFEVIEQGIEYQLVELARARGVVVTDEVRRAASKMAREIVDEERARLTGLGVPESLRKLFAAKKKAEAMRLGKAMSITDTDLAIMIHNAGQLGYAHKDCHQQHVPPHLQLTPEHLVALTSSKPGRLQGLAGEVPKLLNAMANERKSNHGHLFERGEEWHSLFFDYSDLAGHGSHGPHVHYTSHLWTEVSKDGHWASLQDRWVPHRGSLHIACQIEE